MNLYEIIAKSADTALGLQRPDGSMPPGCNGPYNHKETPVRNTAHWLITFLKVYEITGDKAFLQACESCLSYLLSEDARPMNKTFWCRDCDNRDRTNGIIGQAWAIEALATAAENLNRHELSAPAKEVFLLHTFDTKASLWNITDIDGKVKSYDRTFNHQLWFAAAAAHIQPDQDSRIKERISGFLDKMENKFIISRRGRIHHPLTLRDLPLDEIKRYLKYMNRRLKKFGKNTRYKEAGYHAFNLYALAVLKRRFPEHLIWKSGKIQKAIDYIFTEEYVTALDENRHNSDYYDLPPLKIDLAFNRYGYAYNPPGFEVPFIIETFSQRPCEETEKVKSKWVMRQLDKTLNTKNYLLNRNTEDPVTLAARIYEATKLNNIELEAFNE